MPVPSGRARGGKARSEAGKAQQSRVALGEERFVTEYLKDSNGTRAYERANPGVAENTAKTQATRLLRKPHVQQQLVERRAKRTAIIDFDAAQVLAQQARIASADPRKLFASVNGEIKKLKITDLPDDLALAVQDGDYAADGTITNLRFASKDAALDKLGKHYKLYTDKFEITGQLTLEQLIDNAAKMEEGGDE